MTEIKHLITDELGLHARPAGQLVKVAAGFKCDIKVATPNKTADAKRIMGVMQLGAKNGTEIVITCDGADEAAAAEAIKKFIVDSKL